MLECQNVIHFPKLKIHTERRDGRGKHREAETQTQHVRTVIKGWNGLNILQCFNCPCVCEKKMALPKAETTMSSQYYLLID